ncbi:MAG: hypothetical protein IKY62_05790 [Clostridia bacterium]|jgi:hypothetical protein|nr:hypothetical protein [Clostridia bacterium]
MAKKRKCRYTPEELAVHEQAVKLRKMTDEQLVMAFRASSAASPAVSQEEVEKDTDGVKKLIEGLSRGECKGVKGATVYKIQQYAEEMGLI